MGSIIGVAIWDLFFRIKKKKGPRVITLDTNYDVYFNKKGRLRIEDEDV